LLKEIKKLLKDESSLSSAFKVISLIPKAKVTLTLIRTRTISPQILTRIILSSGSSLDELAKLFLLLAQQEEVRMYVKDVDYLVTAMSLYMKKLWPKSR